MALSISEAYMDSVQATLLDPTGKYWNQTMLVGFHNILVTSIIADKPDALTKIIQFTPAAGIEQILPTDAVQFLRAPSNVNGPAIGQVTPEAMYDADPTWYEAVPNKYAYHVIPDTDPLRFRLWPPNDGTGNIWVAYAYAPDDAVSLADPFPLTEGYRMTFRNGALAMAYSINTDRQDLQKAQFYFNLMGVNVSTKIKAQIDLATKVGTMKTSE